MLNIISGSIDKVKAEMKKEKLVAGTLIAKVKSAVRKEKRELSQRDRGTIAEAELIQSFFVSTYYIPVRLKENGMLVNYQLLSKYLKKLKGYDVKVTFEEDITGEKLVMWYTKGNNSGRLELYALPEAIFGRLGNRIPEAKFESAVQIVA
jgi:hypothetical protein